MIFELLYSEFLILCLSILSSIIRYDDNPIETLGEALDAPKFPTAVKDMYARPIKSEIVCSKL